jgi:hypothetical protein
VEGEVVSIDGYSISIVRANNIRIDVVRLIDNRE